MSNIIDGKKIESIIAENEYADPVCVREILDKALEFGGLDLDEVALLSRVSDQDLINEIFLAAQKVKDEIYGKRVVLFAPLYISNLCKNECLYCAFRASNKDLKRKFLDKAQIKEEVEHLVGQGHKRLLLVSGESYPNNDFQYVLDAIDAIYEVKNGDGEIRRVNVNLAPLDAEDFKRLKDSAIGTYQLFQETYHRKVYEKVHIAGKKADYDWRVSVFDRALEAGIDDVGLGVLFGLADWRFEILALIEHANYLQDRFGVGPHTVSVPRMEPALGSDIASNPLVDVNDLDFCKIIAILRLAIPYTGIILSTRESLDIRRKALALGVSQISAGSRTNPGGYGDSDLEDASQFSLGDHRSLDEVVRDVAKLGHMPSFCTACYRVGRTGEDFMCLTKHGKIKKICAPNAVASFIEYLNDYASQETKIAGERLIQKELSMMGNDSRSLTENLLAKIGKGEKDVFV